MCHLSMLQANEHAEKIDQFSHFEVAFRNVLGLSKYLDLFCNDWYGTS